MSPCEEVVVVDGFPWLPGCLPCLFCVCVCVCVGVGVPMTVSYMQFASSAWSCSLSAARCNEAVCTAAQEAQGQHNMIPLGSVCVCVCVCVSVWLRQADQFALPDRIIKARASFLCSMKTPETASVWFNDVLCYFWVCIAVDVQISGCELVVFWVSRG